MNERQESVSGGGGTSRRAKGAEASPLPDHRARRAKPVVSLLTSFCSGGCSGGRLPGTLGVERPRLQRAATLLRMAMAVQPEPATAALLGVVSGWLDGPKPSSAVQRHLQNCVELLRLRLSSQARVTKPAASPPSATRSSAEGNGVGSPAGDGEGTGTSAHIPPTIEPAARPSVQGLWATADASFDAAVRGVVQSGQSGGTEHTHPLPDASVASTVTRDALLDSMLRAGQDAADISEVFAALTRIGCVSSDVTRDEWRSAVVAATTSDVGHADDGVAGSAKAKSGAGVDAERGAEAAAVVAVDSMASDQVDAQPSLCLALPRLLQRRLYAEDVDTLLLLVGCTLFAQQLLLERRAVDALPILRELVNVCPPLLRATFDMWGYSRGYCLLEQVRAVAYPVCCAMTKHCPVGACACALRPPPSTHTNTHTYVLRVSRCAWQLWLEAFSGIICTCIYAKSGNAATEGFAMSVQLCTMLQGKAQYRQMRHTVAEWARQLAPYSARPLLMKGEAMLDQPLSGQDEAEAVPLLRDALEMHKAATCGDGAGTGVEEAEGESADASLYWGVLARSLVETGHGKCDAEACEILREGIKCHPHDVELYLQLGTILEATDPGATIELYTAFPPPPEGSAPSFNHAVLADVAVRLILEAKDFESPHIVDHLVTVGRVLGILSIEKHVQALDSANQVDIIKDAYHGILPDIDQSAFFKQKGWDYTRRGGRA